MRDVVSARFQSNTCARDVLRGGCPVDSVSTAIEALSIDAEWPWSATVGFTIGVVTLWSGVVGLTIGVVAFWSGVVGVSIEVVTLSTAGDSFWIGVVGL